MKLIDYNKIQIGDIIRLEHINKKEIIEGELLEKFHPEWNNIVGGNTSNNPKEWIIERHISSDYILILNTIYKDKLVKTGVGSKWYICYTYH